MKISELRVGNLVYLNDINNCIVSVSGIFFQVDDCCIDWKKISGENDYEIGFGSLLSEIKPIHLTAELLVKCGAKIVQSRAIFILDGPHRTLEAVFYGPNIFIELYESPELSSDELKHFTIGGIKYLHQLQNLYHALIGEELPVNL